MAAETYSGVKFRVVHEKIEPDAELVVHYLKIDEKLSRFLKTQANEGNMSMRVRSTANEFIVKRAGAQMTRLTTGDVVLVRKIEGDVVFCSIGTPSSESRMHAKIYERVPKANLILHFHCNDLLNHNGLGTYQVGPFPYGTRELAEKTAETATKSNLIEIVDHGFVVIASDEEALFSILERFKKNLY